MFRSMSSVIDKYALLIQPDALAAAALTESFESAGFASVRVVATIEGAEVLMQHWKPDIVVVGPELAQDERLKLLSVGNAVDQPVVVTSGYGQQSDPQLTWGVGNLGQPLSSLDLAVRAAFAVVSKSVGAAADAENIH